jgi:hypothetical protein
VQDYVSYLVTVHYITLTFGLPLILLLLYYQVFLQISGFPVSSDACMQRLRSIYLLSLLWTISRIVDGCSLILFGALSCSFGAWPIRVGDLDDVNQCMFHVVSHFSN